METTSAKSGSRFLWIIGVALTAIMLFVIFSSKNGQAPSTTAADDHDSHHTSDPAENPQGNEAFFNMIGKPAPDFAFKDRNGKLYAPAALAGKNVILFFNEGLMCYPACWNQIASFAKDERFQKNDTEVISVVTDPLWEWQKAVAKMPGLAAATVVFDTGAAYSKSFGVLDLPSSMHKGALPGHSYVIIDKQGIVKTAFDDPVMAINNDKLIQMLSQ